MLSRSVIEYLSRVSKPLICERIVFSSDSLRFCFICSFSSSDNFSFFTFSWFSIFSSQRRAFTFRSLAPPEITPDFWNRVPSNDTDYNVHEHLLIQLLTAVRPVFNVLSKTLQFPVTTFSHSFTLSLFNQPVFPELLQVGLLQVMLASKSKLLGIVVQVPAGWVAA